MDVRRGPDDALAQPTRAQLFALLGELRRPAGTEELAQRLDLHPNGIRLHLERLEADGLVLRERERQARGRPRDTWSISPDAQPGGDPPTAYADLGRWLVGAISAGGTRVRDVEATGRDWPRARTAGKRRLSRGADPWRIGRDGLSAQAPPRRRRHAHLLPRQLPVSRRRAERQSVVCGLHRGLHADSWTRSPPRPSSPPSCPRIPT